MLSEQTRIRVGLDARCLNVQHLRGAGKYSWEVLRHLGAGEGSEWHLFSDRPDWPMHLPDGVDVRLDVFEYRGFRLRLWEQFALPRAAREARVDVLHCASMSLPWWQPVPVVVTIHDAIPWLTNDDTWGPRWYRNLLVRAYHKCRAIITVSECSGKDIVKLWPGLNGKVHVIPHGIAPGYLEIQPGPLSERLEAVGIRQPYLLYLGGIMPRKRLDWALRVLEGLSRPQVQLVICGVEQGEQGAIREKVKPEIRSQLCFAPFIPEPEMPRLYQNAAALLYPTLYEGFGFPAQEAQAVGTPALFSPLGSLTELVGPGAVVLPPDDLSAWIDACSSCIDARGSSPTPNEAARRWARLYSWPVCAQRHLDVYRLAATTRASKHSITKQAGVRVP